MKYRARIVAGSLDLWEPIWQCIVPGKDSNTEPLGHGDVLRLEGKALTVFRTTGRKQSRTGGRVRDEKQEIPIGVEERPEKAIKFRRKELGGDWGLNLFASY